MARRLSLLLLCCAVPLALVAAGCGSDDGSGVREVGTDGGSASGSGSGSASGSASDSASGTGLSLEDTQTAGTGGELVAAGVASYSDYVAQQVDETIADTTTFTDAVRAGDLEAAKAAFAPSREGWERIEPIAGLVEAIDGAVDARVDDFAGADDPEFTGWHRLEYLLWNRNTTQGAARFADQLDADLQTLKTELADPRDPARGRRAGGVRADRGGLAGQDHRRGGPLLEHRPLGLRRQRRGRRAGHRAPHAGARAGRPGAPGRASRRGFAEIESSLEPLKDGDG